MRAHWLLLGLLSVAGCAGVSRSVPTSVFVTGVASLLLLAAAVLAIGHSNDARAPLWLAVLLVVVAVLLLVRGVVAL